MYCHTAFEESCTADESTCVEQCTRDRTELDTSCMSEHDRLMRCWADTFYCENGLPAVSACEEQVADLGWCIGVHDDDCKGYCWAAEVLGCGSESCVDDCQIKLGNNCGSNYRSFLSCTVTLNSLNLSCSDGKPVPTGSCVAEEQSYQECMTPQ
jgi:hypothetical protein